ncbi:hypothetical protein [Alteraurantiacibacter aquimixticola]|uniref:PilZ domain-containing protein n=1 Tax=Alteraurantiacibacter aquimixticola TaxID=2489173 RepID=A0A4T3EWH1_9SPHN|nr:hypothetical protein [Alteraurantiacibacter aquimixticola]TIX48813.1 hypothetical protein E5222_13780 [Alteraurantiacibacter aquimixticola]
MARGKMEKTTPPIGGMCEMEGRRVPVALRDLTAEGCSAEADCDWECDADFLQLKIADSIEINGRVLQHKGRRAAIRFFGQLHPAAIERLAAQAA